MKSSGTIFPFQGCAFNVKPKNRLSSPGSQICSPFSFLSFMLTFKSVVHFESIFHCLPVNNILDIVPLLHRERIHPSTNRVFTGCSPLLHSCVPVNDTRGPVRSTAPCGRARARSLDCSHIQILDLTFAVYTK